tara:strand:- start:247 stop:627 length:381 start_codon:yes stop_codon:yes gene_type:complete
LSGSGKSTAAGNIDAVLLETDMFWPLNGGFNPKRLPEAHEWCRKEVEGLLNDGESVVVANTFSTFQEMAPYFELAKTYGVPITVLDLYDGGLSDEELFARNLHGVPLHTIRNMRKRWQHDWSRFKR